MGGQKRPIPPPRPPPRGCPPAARRSRPAQEIPRDPIVQPRRPRRQGGIAPPVLPEDHQILSHKRPDRIELVSPLGQGVRPGWNDAEDELDPWAAPTRRRRAGTRRGGDSGDRRSGRRQISRMSRSRSLKQHRSCSRSRRNSTQGGVSARRRSIAQPRSRLCSTSAATRPASSIGRCGPRRRAAAETPRPRRCSRAALLRLVGLVDRQRLFPDLRLSTHEQVDPASRPRCSRPIGVRLGRRRDRRIGSGAYRHQVWPGWRLPDGATRSGVAPTESALLIGVIEPGRCDDGDACHRLCLPRRFQGRGGDRRLLRRPDERPEPEASPLTSGP